jgi:hypothetical protein
MTNWLIAVSTDDHGFVAIAPIPALPMSVDGISFVITRTPSKSVIRTGSLGYLHIAVPSQSTRTNGQDIDS